MKHMYKNWTIFKTKSFLLQVFEMLINPGDNILLDAPTYSGTLAAVSIAYQQNIVNVTFELNSILVPDLQSYKNISKTQNFSVQPFKFININS